MRASAALPHRQRGIALLLVLLLALSIFAYGVLRQLNAADVATARGDRTAAALVQAKEALIAHALLYGENHKTNATPAGSVSQDDVTLPPGTLPCPEQSYFGSEGSESGSCGIRGASALGRLPWRSLGLSPLRDGDGECLWYAVSGTYKANPGADTINPDSLGQLRVIDPAGNVLAGATAASQVVAAIIAPGPPLAGQDRTPVAGTRECGGNYVPSAYLDSATIGGVTYNNALLAAAAGDVSTLVSGRQSGLNDRIVYITRDEIWRPVLRRSDFASALFDAADDGMATSASDDGTGTPPSGPVAMAQKLAAMIARYGKNNSDTNNHSLPWATPLAVADFAADTFDDVRGVHAGRPPYRVGTSRGDSNNTLVPSGCSSGPTACRLLISGLAGPVAWWRVAGKPLAPDGSVLPSSFEGWWDKWKDHVFYVVSPEFAPGNLDDEDWDEAPNPCSNGGNKCVRVNGQRFAAALVFAGPATAGQTRNTLAERQNPANYLEGNNVSAFDRPTEERRRDLEITGNDRIVCIRAQDLAIDSTCTHGN